MVAPLTLNVLAPTGLSRRRILQAMGLAATAGLGRAAQAAVPLNLFTWQTYGEKPFVEFSATKDFTIRPTYFSSSDEMVAKLRGGGGRLYDMIVPVQNYVQIAARAGLIEPMDTSRLTNLGTLFPEFKESRQWTVDGKTYGVPFVWGANAVAYNRKLTGEIDSIDALFDLKWKGRIGMRDEPEDALAIGALKLGIRTPYQMDEAQLQEVKKLLIAQKPLVRSYWKSIAELQNMLASQEVVVSWAFLSVVKPLRDAGIDCGWVWPKEGAVGWNEGIALVKGSANKAAVEDYANLTLSAEYGKMMALSSRYATTSKEATQQLDPAVVKDLGIDMSELKRLVFKDNPPNRARWVEIWNEVKNA